VAKGRQKIGASRARAAPSQGRAAFHARLTTRRDEIEQAALARVYSISDPKDTENPEYVEGLRAAVCAAVSYGLAAIDRGAEGEFPVPSVLLEQAKLAARNGISLDTVLRRYFAGYTLLGDFLIEEARAEDSLPSPALQRILRDQASLFDRLIAAITAEYERELEGRGASATGRLAERVRGLLAGELLDTSGLAYDFERWHLGVLAVGMKADEALRHVAKALERRLLHVPVDDGTTWAWLGGRFRLDPPEVDRCVASRGPSQVQLVVGEPGHGMAGWRLTHQQARAALPIALRSSRPYIRYADVALLASTLQDDVLATSLRELYLVPLSKARDGGAVLRQTLRAYFTAERNTSSAAAALGVSRQTVINRLSAIEERIARPLGGCEVELEMALRMESLDHSRSPAEHSSG
jgi:hypothetical protein